MQVSGKIIEISNLEETIQQQRLLNKKIVFCQGHFNVIHPGHLRFLEFAKKQGDFLIVAVQGNNLISEKVKDIFFDEKERARGVASLEKIDNVIIYKDLSINNLLNLIKPDFYVMGEEFSKKLELVQDQIDILEKNNGKVIFSSGQIDYSSSVLLSNDLLDLDRKNKEQLKNAILKQKINLDKIQSYLEKFKSLNLLVIGDSIVDQYIACDALGMSAEAPVLNIRELESKQFIGGAAVVSRHVKALGANCSFISTIGDDEPGKLVESELNSDDIKTELIREDGRQTIFKIRYMVGRQKLLRVSRLEDHHITQKTEDRIINYIEKMPKKPDGIIISDFAYGIITPTLISRINDLSKKYGIKLYGDSQSSSQQGDIGKFVGFDLITPTEKEARLALGDKYNGLEQIGTTILEKNKVKNLVITLAEKGFVAFVNHSTDDLVFAKTQHFPALATNPLDVVGAGDSLLTGFALSLCAGANLMEASIIASAVASIAVNKVGNIPVKLEELTAKLQNLIKEVNNEYISVKA